MVNSLQYPPPASRSYVLRLLPASISLPVAARLESGQFRNLRKSQRLRFQFSDGQPLNGRNLRRAGLAGGNRSNRRTSSAGGIETLGEVAAFGGRPGAKPEASYFALGSGTRLKLEWTEIFKPRAPAGFGINGAKKESTLSLSKRKLAAKAKTSPPKTTYATPRATTI